MFRCLQNLVKSYPPTVVALHCRVDTTSEVVYMTGRSFSNSRLLDYNKCKLIVGAAARWPQMTPARH